MRKNKDRPKSQQPPTDRSSQPVRGFIFAEKTTMHLIKGNLNIIYQRNEVESHHNPHFLRNDHVLLLSSVPCLTATASMEYMQLETAVANIAEAFVVNVLSNGCFWSTK